MSVGAHHLGNRTRMPPDQCGGRTEGRPHLYDPTWRGLHFGQPIGQNWSHGQAYVKGTGNSLPGTQRTVNVVMREH